LKINSVDQKLFKFNFSQGTGKPGTERGIAFSQLAVKAGPLPSNVNAAQNAAMKWIKLKVSSQTATLQ
jgi:hypothetical protein